MFPFSMGDGVSFPQRHMDEDEDSLLSGRQSWMEEGGQEPSGRSDDTRSPSYSTFFKNKSTDSFLLKLSKINFLRNRQYGALGPISLNTQLTDVEDLKFFCGGHCFDGMIHCCNDPLARSHYFCQPCITLRHPSPYTCPHHLSQTFTHTRAMRFDFHYFFFV